MRLVRFQWKLWIKRINCPLVWECWLKCQQPLIHMTKRTFHRELHSTPSWPQTLESFMRSGNRVLKISSKFSKSRRSRLLMALTPRNHRDLSRHLQCRLPWREKISKRSCSTRSTSRISITIVNLIRRSQSSTELRTTFFLRNRRIGWCHRLCERLRVVNHQLAVILASLHPRCQARFSQKELCRKIWVRRID